MRMGELRGNQLPDGVGQPGDEGLVADDGVVGPGEDVELAGRCVPQVHDEGGAGGVGRVLGAGGGAVVGRRAGSRRTLPRWPRRLRPPRRGRRRRPRPRRAAWNGATGPRPALGDSVQTWRSFQRRGHDDGLLRSFFGTAFRPDRSPSALVQNVIFAGRHRTGALGIGQPKTDRRLRKRRRRVNQAPDCQPVLVPGYQAVPVGSEGGEKARAAGLDYSNRTGQFITIRATNFDPTRLKATTKQRFPTC